MLKKFFVVCILCGAAVYFSYDFINSGKYRELLIRNADKNWAPAAIYYLGNYFIIVQQPDRAEKVYEDIIRLFPSGKYYENALYKYFYLESKYGVKSRAVKRGRAYLEEFPETARAEQVRKRIDILEKF